MIGYIFGIITLVILVAFTISSNYSFILSNRQVHELWIGTLLAIILLGFVRAKLLNLDPIASYIFVPAALFAVWYILTKLSANMINKDQNANIIRDTAF